MPPTLAQLPPMVVALIALAAALGWQSLGALALMRLVPATFGPSWRLMLAWFLWLPASGAVTLGLVLLGVAGPAMFVAGAVVASALALAALPLLRPVVADARARWSRWFAEARPYERWLWRLGLLMQGIAWLFAAHPQRLYDQLNYHLVVGQLVVRDGQPFTGAFDPHVGFAGLIEYALAWHRAIAGSRLLFNGMAQVAVMLATVPILIACGMKLGRASLGLLGLLFVALPGLIPEATILRMAKPDGILLTGAVLLLTLLARAPQGWAYAAMALSALMLGCKLTFGHAMIGLALALVIVRPPVGKVRPWLPLLGIGFSGLALQLAKNAKLFGNPVYPVAASLFPSSYSDATTRAYWKHIAFGGHARLTGWLGPFLFGRDAGGLWFVLALAIALIVWRRPTRRESFGQIETPRALAGVIGFIAAVWATWPIFYGGYIPARFVGPFTGALFVLFLLLQSRVGTADRRWFTLACACAALLSSQLDRSIPGLLRGNTRSAERAFARVAPRSETARRLDAMHLFLPGDTVVADAPDKLYFDARLLFEAPLSPQERAMLRELRRTPVAAAERYRVAAVVAVRGHAMSRTLADIWRGLAPRGQVLELGRDEVLVSRCYFRARCRGS